MRKKRGFTLVELLAVIVILAIILLIAVPKVNNMIEDVKIETMKKNEDMMVKATKNYLTGNKVALPDNIGDIKEIKLSDLQAANYMGDIESPVNSNTACNGYVLVTKLSDNQFNYEPYLNCYDSSIGSVGYDRLLAHYKFDDFQEPTINLWQGGLSVYNNLGIPATLVATGEYYKGGSVYRLTMTPTTQSQVDSIRANLWNHGVYGSSITYSAYTQYSSSIYWKPINKTDVEVNGLASNIGGWINGNHELLRDGWHRCISHRDGTASTAQTGHVFWSFRSPSFVLGDSIIIDWVAPQIEQKSYVTPYVNGTRTGAVKDYSNNGKNAPLPANITPQWTNVSKIGKGAYFLDGVDDYIPLPSSMSTMLNGSKFTISAWVKASGLATGMSIAGIVNLGYGLSMYISSSGALYGRIDSGSSLPAWSTTGINLFDNVYHHVAMTYDGTKMRLYVDGVKNVENTATWSNRYSNAGAIGYEANNPPVYRYKGYIDDVRIYGRALSDDEVGYLYKADK